MIEYSTFEDLNKLLSGIAPILNSIVTSFRVHRLDIPHFDMLNEKRGIKSSWVAQRWWYSIERGQKIPPEEFFNAFVPGWDKTNSDFIMITMDSYATGRVYRLNAKDFLEFHTDYALHSGNESKFFQHPGDYIAIDLNSRKGYGLMHEGYTAIFDLE